MNGFVILLVAVVLFICSYIIYGGWLAKKWGLDDNIETPAFRLRDDVDYCPADKKVVFGHQFSSIAGAGPITGPIQAIIFGWLPVYLWIVIGSMFIGGVHDWGSMFASVRHDGKSIGEVIRVNVGENAKKLFNVFAWLALVLVVAAFTDICAGTFAFNPANPLDLTGARAGTASLLFIVLAIAFGFLVYRKHTNLAVSTIVGVLALFFCIWIGYVFPVVKLSKTAWYIILLVYIALASILPVWILLQPRDYLCSFLLYATLAGAFVGILIVRPTLNVAAFNGFKIGDGASAQYLFPILFITVACGAISGFHSLVSSGTASKQVSRETDTKFIGYGAMLVEGIIAVISVIAVGYIGANAQGTPAQIFASSVAAFMNGFGLPIEIGKVFVTLAFSAFALTSLDTATRLARYQIQELVTVPGKEPGILSKSIPATIVTIACGGALLLYGYTKIWPIFGSSNQLLGGLALLGLTVWFYKTGKPYIVTMIPMIFMFCVTLSALVLLIKNNFLLGNYLLGVIAVVLFCLSIILIYTAYQSLKKPKNLSSNAVK